MLDLPILSIAISLPIVSALYIMFFISHSKSPNKQLYAMYVAILSSVFTFLASIYLLLQFDRTDGTYQFVEHYRWLDNIGLDFYLGVDGLSVYFIFLTSMLSLICIIASLFTIKKQIKEFLLCFLFIEAFCIGAFSALNLLLFYFFFEAILIPMYLIIGIWGSENRVYASIKFFLYTFFGSILFLGALIYINVHAHSFNIQDLVILSKNLPHSVQQILWVMMFIAFAIKVPIPPFHTWLPDAHVQAPTAGSVILAGILLKLGGYAMLRILIPLFPLVSQELSLYVMILGAVAIVYASLVALAQKDMKKMIAYSSIAHMGYVIGGIFSFTETGMSGAVFQMISHGLISAGLFLIVGILYERRHTKEIEKYGGVAGRMPVLAVLFMIITLGSVGLPGTSGFIGEFFSIFGIFKSNQLIAIIASSGVVLCAVYMLKLYKSIMFGVVKHEEIYSFADLRFDEKIVLFPLIIFIILLGIAPGGVLASIGETVHVLISNYMGING